jgi:hypothetical protein
LKSEDGGPRRRLRIESERHNPIAEKVPDEEIQHPEVDDEKPEG